MSNWLYGLVGVSFLGLLVDVLMPKGKTKKYVVIVYSVMIMLVIISPLVSILDGIDGFDSQNIDNQYVSVVNLRKNNYLIDGLKVVLQSKYSVDCELKYYVDDIGEIREVIIKLNRGINSDPENIIEVENMIEDAVNLLGIDKEMVIVWT